MQKRFSHGFSVLANYTISKSTDITSYATIEGNSVGPDPFNFNNDRGLSDFDTPQCLVVSGVVEHPKFQGVNPFVRAIIGGWQSNFIFTAQSGTPITIFSGVDNALMGIGGNRADFTGDTISLSGSRTRADQIDGDLSQRASYIIGALIDYYMYTGDPAVFTPIDRMAGYLVDFCQTGENHGWPRMLISVPTMGKHYGRCVLGASDDLAAGQGKIRLDNMAQVALEFVRAYEMTGNTRWYDAARHWADLLALNRSLQSGSPPWAVRRQCQRPGHEWSRNRRGGHHSGVPG